MIWKSFLAPVLVSCVRSAAEVVVVTLVGLAPLFALIIRASEIGLPPEKLLHDALSQGQLFFYAFSMIGTLVWLTIVNWRVKNGVVKGLLGFCVVVSIILTFSFGVFDPTFQTLTSSSSIWWSYALFFLNMAIYFLIMVLINLEPVDLAETLKNGASAMIKNIGGREVKDE